MAIVVVSSAGPGDGKTGVAAAIARHYAYLGVPVRIVRTGESPSAERDAAWFGTLEFAPGSASRPVDAASVADQSEGLVVVEAEADDALRIDGQHVVVLRGDAARAPETPAPAAIVRTALRAPSEALPGSVPTISLTEDRTLAGFSIDEVRATLRARTLVEGDAPSTCDYLVIAPIASDAGQPYFRRFHTKAVVVRYDRTDMHLAAMQADPEFLVLTGGREPSGYLFDAAEAKGIPVLLSANDTENTVMALEHIFEHTHFRGERKLARMAELLERSPLFAGLAI